MNKLHFPDVPEAKTCFFKLFYKYSHVNYLPIGENGIKYLNSTFEIDFKLLFGRLLDLLRMVVEESLSLSIVR